MKPLTLVILAFLLVSIASILAVASGWEGKAYTIVYSGRELGVSTSFLVRLPIVGETAFSTGDWLALIKVDGGSVLFYGPGGPVSRLGEPVGKAYLGDACISGRLVDVRVEDTGRNRVSLLVAGVYPSDAPVEAVVRVKQGTILEAHLWIRMGAFQLDVGPAGTYRLEGGSWKLDPPAGVALDVEAMLLRGVAVFDCGGSRREAILQASLIEPRGLRVVGPSELGEGEVLQPDAAYNCRVVDVKTPGLETVSRQKPAYEYPLLLEGWEYRLAMRLEGLISTQLASSETGIKIGLCKLESSLHGPYPILSAATVMGG